MEVFYSTTGISAEYLSGFTQYLLSFCVVIFGCFVLKGSYTRWVNDDSDGLDLVIDVVVIMCVIVFISILIN